MFKIFNENVKQAILFPLTPLASSSTEADKTAPNFHQTHKMLLFGAVSLLR